MKILAVSDITSKDLETIVIEHPGRLSDVNLIVSCGDLDRSYLEFLVKGVNRDLFFVSGNHPFEMESDARRNDSPGEYRWEQVQTFKRRVVHSVTGTSDLHGRVEVFRNYLIAGFGGSMWYNGKENQFTESRMSRIVTAVERQIDLLQQRDRLMGRKHRDVVIVSHSPIYAVHDESDVRHTGFKCFRRFLKDISPLLWIHGHTHPADADKNESSVIDGTTVLNAYGYKLITINRREITVDNGIV